MSYSGKLRHWCKVLRKEEWNPAYAGIFGELGTHQSIALSKNLGSLERVGEKPRSCIGWETYTGLATGGSRVTGFAGG